MAQMETGQIAPVSCSVSSVVGAAELFSSTVHRFVVHREACREPSNLLHIFKVIGSQLDFD